MNEGAKIFQALLPVNLHRRLTTAAYESNLSKSEIVRIAIELFLENKSNRKTSGGSANEKIQKTST